MNIKIIFSYDGSSDFGWQKTRTGPSVQETLEKALLKIVQKKISVEAASRTDRGVHARGQTAHFSLEEAKDLSSLQFSLNAVLPRDIRVVEIEKAPADFHSTLNATAKEYRYHICLGPVQEPLHRRYSWHRPYPLELESMRRAAATLTGLHDFSSFTTERVKDGLRTLYELTLLPLPENRLEIRLLGDRFLYKMARRIVGTLVAVGRGRMSKTDIPSLFAAPDRALAGMTAPAHGLCLQQVFYNG